MHRTNIYVILLATIAAIIYAYYSMPEKPEKGISYTPKQYIERVEKQKAERRETDPLPPSSLASD